MVLLDSFLSLPGLCRVFSLLRPEAWQVVASMATAGASSKLKARAAGTGGSWSLYMCSDGVGVIGN